MIGNIFGIIVVFLCFGFIIFIHELGHFLMARKVGVKVLEFCLGFGPKLWSKKDEKTGTLYAIRAFPFGGFVAMEGEEIKEGEKVNTDDPTNFQNKTKKKKMQVIAAGPLMNYISAILIFIFVGFAFGVGEMYLKPKVGKILENSPASKIGLQEGDFITSINGTKVTDAMDMIDLIHKYPAKTIDVTYTRDGKEFSASVETMTREIPIDDNVKDKDTEGLNIIEKDGKKYIQIGLLGFQPDTKSLDIRFKRVSAGAVFTDCFDKTWKFTVSPFVAIAMICKGQVKSKEVIEGSSGPVGIGQMFFEMYNKGFPALLFFIAIINVLIGVFNLIPFPALDGSKIVTLGIAQIIGKDFDPEKENMVHTIGFVILLIAVVFFTYNDIVRLIKGISFFK